MKKLARYTFATHVKDLKPMKGVLGEELALLRQHADRRRATWTTMALARLLKEAGYKGFLAVEIDFLHPDYGDDEDAAVAKSVKELKRIAAAVG